MTRNAAKLVLAIAALACASAVLAKSSDRNQTMDIKAGTSDCTVTETGPCILTGNVRIAQGTLNIQATRADIRRAGGEPVAVKLTGSPVQLSQQLDSGGTMNATSAQVDYDLQQDTVVFTGGATVKQPGQGSIAGERIVYNMRTGQVQAGGEKGVHLQFEPRNRTPGADAKPAGSKPAGSN